MIAESFPPKPYPGLRPFKKAEWSIFFGRQPIIDEIVTRLTSQKMVTVHGASGSGKSSVILAGVLPFLEQEMGRLDIGWHTAIMRPGSSPLWNLATALARLEAGPDGERDAKLNKINAIRRLLDEGENASQLIAAELDLGQDEQFCILIDQFEELFRYAREIGRDEAELLIAFLSGFLDQPSEGMHIIVTMRSDYLGDCAQFDRFSETINQTQYLLPRMSKSNLLRAIREPANLYNGSVSRELAQRLLAESRSERDSLPLLQHALMRLWDQTNPLPPVKPVTAAGPTGLGGSKRASARSERPIQLSRRHLDLSGFTNLRDLLSDHADVVLKQATGNDHKALYVAEHLFRAITDVDLEGRAVRRPTLLSELFQTTGNTPTLNTIIESFSAPDCSFLHRSSEADPVIDISHEALIRCWHRLNDETPDEEGKPNGWILRELQDARAWRALAYQAIEHQVIDASLVDRRFSWIRSLPGPAWAKRYGGDWERVENLIEVSLKSRDAALERERSAREVKQRLQVEITETAQRQAKRSRIVAIIMTMLMMVASGLGWFAWDRMQEAQEQKTHAQMAEREAEIEAIRNKAALLRSDEQWDLARQQYDIALSRAKSGFGDDHPKAGFVLGELGKLYRERDDPRAATKYFDDALKILDSTSSLDSDDQAETARLRIEYALLELEKAQTDRGKSLYQKGLAELEASVVDITERLFHSYQFEKLFGGPDARVAATERLSSNIADIWGKDHPQRLQLIRELLESEGEFWDADRKLELYKDFSEALDRRLNTAQSMLSDAVTNPIYSIRTLSWMALPPAGLDQEWTELPLEPEALRQILDTHMDWVTPNPVELIETNRLPVHLSKSASVDRIRDSIQLWSRTDRERQAGFLATSKGLQLGEGHAASLQLLADTTAMEARDQIDHVLSDNSGHRAIYKGNHPELKKLQSALADDEAVLLLAGDGPTIITSLITNDAGDLNFADINLDDYFKLLSSAVDSRENFLLVNFDVYRKAVCPLLQRNPGIERLYIVAKGRLELIPYLALPTFNLPTETQEPQIISENLSSGSQTTATPARLSQPCELEVDTAIPLEAGTAISVSLNFEWQSATLIPAARYALDKLGEAINSSGLAGETFVIEGHSVPTEATENPNLTQARADAVRTYLIENHGIAPWRLTALGLGDTRPLDPAHPDSPLNRRVSIVRKVESRGIVALRPIEAAPLPPGPPRFLGDTYEITLIPSLAWLLYEKGRSCAENFDLDLLAFAPATKSSPALLALPALSPLPSTEEEVFRAKSLMPHSSILTGDYATAEAFLRPPRNARILHIASHGFASWDKEPDRVSRDVTNTPGLVLHDRIVRPSDLLTNPIDSELVILSTSDALIDNNDHLDYGVSRLAKNFLSAGAHAVLGTLWSPSDQGAMQLVVTFLEIVKSNPEMSYAAALGMTITQLDADGQLPHVYAAYSLIGDAIRQCPLQIQNFQQGF